MSRKKNSSQAQSSQSQVDNAEAWVDDQDDYEDVRYTLQEFNTNRKGFYCFSSDDFED